MGTFVKSAAKNWKTTTAGLLGSFLAFLHMSGVTVGHVGNTDFVGLGSVVAGAVVAALAKDKDVTGTGDNATR